MVVGCVEDGDRAPEDQNEATGKGNEDRGDGQPSKLARGYRTAAG